MITRSPRATALSAIAAVGAALFSTVGVATLAMAQTPPAAQSASQAANNVRTPNDGGYVDTSVPVLSLAEIESRVTAKGLTVKELEVEGLIVEVDAYDAQGRKVELKMDRRSGEILAAKVKAPRR